VCIRPPATLGDEEPSGGLFFWKFRSVDTPLGRWQLGGRCERNNLHHCTYVAASALHLSVPPSGNCIILAIGANQVLIPAEWDLAQVRMREMAAQGGTLAPVNICAFDIIS
jgi:hypothetical protein